MATPKPESASLAVESWRGFTKNTLRGFATIRLPVGGAILIIKDITLHRKGDRVWFGFPAKPRLGSDGQAQRDGEGRIMYDNILQWADREHNDRFTARLAELIEADHPGALD